MSDLNGWQRKYHAWATVVYGEKSINNPKERGLRVLEEAVELAQALGVSESSCRDVVDEVFDREHKGNYVDETVDVLICTLVCSASNNINLESLITTKLQKLWEDADAIKKKYEEADTKVRDVTTNKPKGKTQ